jgi:hypothetical protein
VVFCGDLVGKSGDPAIGSDSDVTAWPAALDRIPQAGGPGAIFAPGRGAIVDSAFVQRQQARIRLLRGEHPPSL